MKNYIVLFLLLIVIRVIIAVLYSAGTKLGYLTMTESIWTIGSYIVLLVFGLGYLGIKRLKYNR